MRLSLNLHAEDKLRLIIAPEDLLAQLELGPFENRAPLIRVH